MSYIYNSLSVVNVEEISFFPLINYAKIEAINNNNQISNFRICYLRKKKPIYTIIKNSFLINRTPLKISQEEYDGIDHEGKMYPHPVGDRLSASYANFYMGKDYILLPKFNVTEDQEAFDVLNNFYKGKKKINQMKNIVIKVVFWMIEDSILVKMAQFWIMMELLLIRMMD